MSANGLADFHLVGVTEGLLDSFYKFMEKNLLSQENQQIIYKQTEGIRKNLGLDENLFYCIKLFRAVM